MKPGLAVHPLVSGGSVKGWLPLLRCWMQPPLRTDEQETFLKCRKCQTICTEIYNPLRNKGSKKLDLNVSCRAM